MGLCDGDVAVTFYECWHRVFVHTDTLIYAYKC